MDKVSERQGDNTLRAEANTWVVRFNGDEPPTPEEILALQAWAKRSPAHRAELDHAEARWQDTNQLSELAVPLCRRCDVSGKGSESTRGGWAALAWFARRRSASWGAFASLVIATALLLNLNSPSAVVENGVYGTAVGELRLLTLEDGSQVQLDTASQAEIEFNATSRRIYLLQGKAHFEVAKNAERPFEVYVGGGLVRAVGTAVGRNPISFLIPCHRALRKSGGLGGYHWGLPVKRAMLAWEAARADAAIPGAETAASGA